ncbi:MAG TPA: lysophospholipid acyltransferase family protein [Noviherbaspirillum sp.]|jgi:KDO2-lipid IV(A) lauroyltransferase|uniref:lysophospholipid acyltransferase family protein n=1 Tax=Noviherbaspirillum sp. TaxID=1926288 RepID=UPI002DDD90A5|nr:lysophospholipid acyltransferase family protein [Noviherbaspirillum sp.]HEV2611181.1 lysophospholipid acyltransferase family protein [Noviherbaspirillum sp.]
MLLFLFRLLSKLPLPALHALGATLGEMAWWTSASYRNRLRDNIRRAGFPDQLKSAIREAGKSVLELPFVWCARQDRVVASASMEDWDLVQATLDANRGVIFLTPHLGCFEILAQVVSFRLPLTVLYRPPRKAALKPLIEGARARTSLALAPANLSGVRMLLKAVKQGGAIGLLPDQVPQQGEGVWADFFGKPAYTMTLPAKLQQMTGAPILLAYAERLPHGKGFVLRFVPFTHTLGDTPAQQARAINAAMEELIARCPSQYFWSYNRYKTPAGAASPTQQEEAK